MVANLARGICDIRTQHQRYSSGCNPPAEPSVDGGRVSDSPMVGATRGILPVTWWQKLLNWVYRCPTFFEDGSRILYFPRENQLRYVVPDSPRDFIVSRPKASLWIPLTYDERSRTLSVNLAAVSEWEVPQGVLTNEERDDIRRKLQRYVEATRGRFVLY